MNYLKLRYLRLSAIALVIFLTSCRSSGVTVDIVNESGKPIETVEFWRESADQPTPTLLESTGPLQTGKKQRIVLSDITGEGAYSTQVTFADGTQLEGDAGYVEGGYRVIETVKAAEVISEVNLY